MEAFAGPLRRLMELGSVPSDPDELRVRKVVLVLSTVLMGTLSFVWVLTYGALGLWVSAAIPFSYQIASVFSIAVFARTHRYALFRRSQLVMSLVFPFVLQWSLGGFTNASAISLWGVTSPLGALLFVGASSSIPWFASFVALVGVSAWVDGALAASAPLIPRVIVITFFALNIVGVATTAYALLQYFVRAREAVLDRLARAHRELEREQAKSERLLLNVLPAQVAARLKNDHGVIADHYPAVTVLFADIVGFTPLSAALTPPTLVALLDRIFARWDALARELGIEKIKTIGDAYMAAAGVPVPRADHADAIAAMALAMSAELDRVSAGIAQGLQVRIGIDTGPVVAGVIGQSKFAYDLWGETVTTASRMESHAAPGTIHVSERAYEALRDRFDLHPRGVVDVKGLGPMRTYVLTGRRTP